MLWGNRLMTRFPFLGPDGSLPEIMRVRVPYGDVLASWAEALPDANGFATIQVNYILYRAGRELGRPPTPHPVRVNLSQAGGEDPDPDTPWNEGLGRPEVRHSEWVDPGRIDYIPDASIEDDHSVVVPWFARDADGNVTAADAFVAGDTIQLVYAGTVIAETKVVAEGDVAAKLDFVLPLPWEIVKQHGSGMKLAQYLVTRMIGDAENVSSSPPANVEVEDTGDVPGGVDGLPAAHWTNPAVIWSNVDKLLHEPVIVPAYEGMRVGDLVRVLVTANFWDPWEQEMGDPIEAAYWGGDDDFNPQPDPEYRHEIVLSESHLDKPLTFRWSKDLIEWIYPYGVARIDYTVTRADGSHRTDAPQSNPDIRVDTSHNSPGPYPPPDAMSGKHSPRRISLSETLRLARTLKGKERQAALNKFARQYITTPAQRRYYLSRRKDALAALSKARKV